MAELTEGLLNSPFFGLGLSAAAWCAGLWVQKKTGWVLCNPLLIAGLLIIAFLAAFHIPLEQYNIGGDMIKLMLGPVTAVLALNIYRQREILREHFLPVLAGCLAGSAVSLFSVLALCQVFQMEDLLTASLLPKSVTTAIAVGIAESRAQPHARGFCLGDVRADTVELVRRHPSHSARCRNSLLPAVLHLQRSFAADVAIYGVDRI